MAQNLYSDVFIVIPAKNEEKYVKSLIEQIINLGFENIVLVNDSSTDNTGPYAELYDEVTVLDHIINLGPGASTQTGIAYAVDKNARIIATIDADLQHNPEDIINLVEDLEKHDYDLVIGSRFLKPNDIPPTRIFYNKVANIISYFLTGVYLTDSQSGLKVISGRLARNLDLNYDGFEFCMEIIKQAKNQKAKIHELPAEVSYSSDTTRKGQNLISGLRIVSRLLSPFT